MGGTEKVAYCTIPPFFFKPIFFIFSLKHKTDISKVFFVLVRLRSSGLSWLAQTRFSGPQLAGGPGFPRWGGLHGHWPFGPIRSCPSDLSDSRFTLDVSATDGDDSCSCSWRASSGLCLSSVLSPESEMGVRNAVTPAQCQIPSSCRLWLMCHSYDWAYNYISLVCFKVVYGFTLL